MSNRPEIRGQIFVRNVNPPANKVLPPGKKLVMFCGVMEVPEDTPLKDEHQHAFFGANEKGADILSLNILTQEGVMPLPKNMTGYRMDQILTEPVWRI